MVYFQGYVFRGETMNAIGLFKTENKDAYLDMRQTEDGFLAESKEGISLRKLNKGCLVYQTEKENGYVLSIVDNTHKNNGAHYWKVDFLKVLVLNNDFHQTHGVLGIAKQFVSQRLEEIGISKTEKIDLLNRSMAYFKTKEEFIKEAFETETFSDREVIDSFRKFDEAFNRNMNPTFPAGLRFLLPP